MLQKWRSISTYAFRRRVASAVSQDSNVGVTPAFNVSTTALVVVVTPPSTHKHWLSNFSMWKLFKTHGLPLTLYFCVLEEIVICTVTFLLHFDYLGADTVKGMLTFCKVDKWVDVDKHLSTSFTVGPLNVSGRLLCNCGIAEVLVGAVSPFLLLPFCIATLPRAKGVCLAIAKWRPKGMRLGHR
jgi:hypothetical protein